MSYDKKIKKLKDWANGYYVENNPKATDEEYDFLQRDIIKIEEKMNRSDIDFTSPIHNVGTGKDPFDGNFKKLLFKNRMWSQQDIFTKEELGKWLAGILEFEPLMITSECKFDGLSLKLFYKEGRLVEAATRGNGLTGEVVTDNVRMIETIPLTLPIPIDIEINGEVVIHKSDFEVLNTERASNGLPLFANPRNAAAGSIRLLDSLEVAKRKLQFYPWEYLGAFDTIPSDKLYEVSLAFKSNPLVLKANTRSLDKLTSKDYDSLLACLLDHYKTFNRMRDEIPVGLDGVIFKVANEGGSIFKSIGYTAKYPKWSCAYKFPAVEKVTKVLDIKLQVGRTGVVTPIAMLEPILIDGSTVSRATLHNFEEIRLDDLRINDSVILIKSGDIIPKITKVFKDRRDGSEIEIVKPVNCPDCDSILVVEDILIKCVNEDCPSRVLRKLELFVGRDYMNILGLGTAVLNDFVTNNLIKTPLDLYTISRDKLELLDGYGDRKINNILRAIEGSKGIALDRLIAAMGIPGFGRSVAKELVSKYGMDILTIDSKTLESNDGVGETTSYNFRRFMIKHKDYIDSLMDIVKPTLPEKGVGIYENEKVVLTGSFIFGKSTVKEFIEANGGEIKSSVTKDTTLLIYGDNPGTKLAKAESMGIKTKEWKDE